MDDPQNFSLNPQQQQAATYDQGHVLVLAGAGTGKTRTIIARAAYLISQGVALQRILLLTFTRRAAREMIQRLYEISGETAAGIMAGTFHHFCLYSMRRMPRQFGLEGATVIDRDDQVQLMKLVRGGFKNKSLPLPRAAELVNLRSYARNTNQPMETYLQTHTEYDREVIPLIIEAAQGYDRRKRDNRYLDYDDILYIFAKTLHEVPETRERIRAYYDHILVDEMQDTNPLQWLILDGLRDPAQLFCVGDDAQSIYAFRGADFRNVHAFSRRVPNGQVLRLERNYRSTQGILDLSNWLLSRSPLKYGKKLKAHRKAISLPLLRDFDSDFDEARWIAQDLLTHRAEGHAWSEHMIITRTGHGARAVESFLVEKKIPYRFVGGISLFQAAHVKDLLALLRAALSHHDELAWARYLTLWRGIGDVTAARLIAKLRSQPEHEAALTGLAQAPKVTPEMLEPVAQARRDMADPPLAVANAAQTLAKLLELRYDKWATRKKDFELLARLAANHRSLGAFIETYVLDPVTASDATQGDQEDVVTLTTAHSAKGTEARTCYLIRVEPGMYPHFRSVGDPDQEEEERRILYVAMTRAKDELIITRTYRTFGFQRGAWGGFGKAQAAQAKYFFDDLNDELLNWNGGGDGRDVDYDYFDPIQSWDRDG
ncbi:MAG: ATP-dependent helicase [Desulfobacterales bacterium]